MPTMKKRINLSVPDNIYEQLKKYKDENGIESDATACLQLIVKQLRANEQSKVFFNVIQGMSRDELAKASQEGILLVKDAAEKAK